MVDRQPPTIRELKKGDLDISTLRIIVLASEMTVSKAAPRIGRSAWSAHRRVKKLEKQIGQKLFQKQGRKNVPTDAGLVLIAYARRILAMNDDVVACLRNGDYAHEALWLRVNHDPRWILPNLRVLESPIREMRAARSLSARVQSQS